MGNLLTYSGITTKIRAMEKRMMHREDYERISVLESTADFINFLKQQPTYRELFINFDESSLHRGQIEAILGGSLYKDYIKIYRFANGKQRNVLSLIFFRYEVNILKICLQNVFNKEANLYLSFFTPFFDGHSKLKMENLSNAKTMDEFVLALSGTDYHSLFTRLRNAGYESLHEYEVELDLYYFKRVWKLKERILDGKERAFFTHMLGTEIDFLNILWIYRSKQFYDMDFAKILADLIPCRYKLNHDSINQLAEASSTEEFFHNLEATYYGPFFKTERFPNMEQIARSRITKLCEESSRKYPSSMAPILNYLHLREQELNRLTTALECIRYKLEPDETLRYILDAS